MAEETTNAVTVQVQPPQTQPQRSVVPAGPRGLVLSDLDAMWRFSSYVAKSGLAPKGVQTPEAIFIAIQMGAECGLPPMASLQNIAVINGRPALWGDAQLAVVRGTGELESFVEWFEARGKRVARVPAELTDDVTAACQVKRRGYPPTEQAFSVSDAKRANLWGKESPWKYYPARMLQMRARAFALRDQFGDALRGLHSAEESYGPTIDVETGPLENQPAQTVKLFSDAYQLQPAAGPPVADAIPLDSTRFAGAPLKTAEDFPPVEDGLGPVAKPESPAPAPAPAAPYVPTPSEKLMGYLQEYEIDISDFGRWAARDGHVKLPPATWSEVPGEVATKLWPARKLIASAILAQKNQQKPRA